MKIISQNRAKELLIISDNDRVLSFVNCKKLTVQNRITVDELLFLNLFFKNVVEVLNFDFIDLNACLKILAGYKIFLSYENNLLVVEILNKLIDEVENVKQI